MDYNYFNITTIYFEGNIIKYKDKNYIVRFPINEQIRSSVLGECPDTSKYFHEL